MAAARAVARRGPYAKPPRKAMHYTTRMGVPALPPLDLPSTCRHRLRKQRFDGLSDGLEESLLDGELAFRRPWHVTEHQSVCSLLLSLSSRGLATSRNPSSNRRTRVSTLSPLCSLSLSSRCLPLRLGDLRVTLPPTGEPGCLLSPLCFSPSPRAVSLCGLATSRNPSSNRRTRVSTLAPTLALSPLSSLSLLSPGILPSVAPCLRELPACWLKLASVSRQGPRTRVSTLAPLAPESTLVRYPPLCGSVPP